MIYATGAEYSLIFFGTLTIICVRYTQPIGQLARFAAATPLPLIGAALLTALLQDRAVDLSRLLTEVVLVSIYALFLVITGYESYQVRSKVTRFAKRAKAGAEAKSRFIANISHELRTPLNGIMGMGRLLQDTSLNTEQRELLDTVQRSGDTLLRLINEILDYSKLDAKGMTLERHPVQLRTLFSDVAALLRVLAVEKGLSLELDIDPLVPEWIEGDELRLRQMIMNLTSNAIRFTESGSVTLRVGINVDGQPGADTAALRFEVEDTGIGIPESFHDSLFSAFSQADASTTRRYGGTGLGLAIVKQLIELMGGTISFTSTVGQGTCFRLDAAFPISAAPTTAPQAPLSTASDTTTNALRILVAEDNPVNQQVVKAMLKRLGYRATLAENGAKAVSAAAAHTYDLILMDLLMPEMDGLEAATLIQKQPASPEIAIVSANVSDDDRARSQAVGVAEFLPKPIVLEDLDRLLQRVAARRLPAVGPP
ncbi:MAG: ATP-binding protein [Pseudomonadota bacterium]